MVFNLILVFQIILFGKPSSKPLLASAYSPMQYEHWPWVQECCAPWRREGPHGANALLSAGTAQCTIWPRISCSSCCFFKCPQMISQHVRTMVHTGMGAGSLFLKVVPFSTRKTSWASFVAFEKKIIPSPPPPPYFRLYRGSKMLPLPLEQ